LKGEIIMKKFLALISAAAIFCSATPFAVNAADDSDTPVKNWKYFASLSDEEIEEEFDEFLETSDITSKYWYEFAIEDYDSVAACISAGLVYGNIYPGVEFNFSKKGDLKEKDAEYYGFTNTYYGWDGQENEYGSYEYHEYETISDDDGIINMGKVPFNGLDALFFESNGGGTLTFPTSVRIYSGDVDRYDAYNLLRLILTFYNSPFCQEYGKDVSLVPELLCGGNSYLAGDINLDANVDISDLVAVTCYCIDSEANPICKAALEVADVYNTGDGVNSLDALTIQQYLVKMISEIRYAPETEYNC
jgi:hypothetical protein